MRSPRFVCLVCVALTSALIAGCGSGDAPSTSIAAPGDGAQTLTGPTSVEAAEKKLVGVWAGKVDIIQDGYTKKLTGLENEEIRAQFTEFIENVKTTKMQLELKGDRTMQMSVTITIDGQEMTQPSDGTWKVSEVNGNQTVVSFVRSEDNYAETQAFTFQSDDAFSTEGPGDEELQGVAALRFKRLR